MFVHHLLVILAFVAYTQQQIKDPAFMENWNKMKEECAKEDGVNLDDIKKAWDENRFPNDNKFKCFYKCLCLKAGTIDASGEVVDDKLKQVAVELNDARTAAEIVEECGPIKGTDLCDTAYRMMACVKAAILD